MLEMSKHDASTSLHKFYIKKPNVTDQMASEPCVSTCTINLPEFENVNSENDIFVNFCDSLMLM